MDNNIRYITLDCEMGGIGLKYSLLTVAFIITDANGKILDTLDLALYNDVKDQEGDYIVCAGALEVNKINLIEHAKRAIPYKKGGTMLYEFINKWSDKGANKLIPVGHGINGDLAQIWDKLMSRKTWEVFCSYRNMDTSSVIQFLKVCGHFPETSGSLTTIANYLNIKFDDTDGAHTAKGDAMVTLAVFLKLKNLMTKV